MDQNPVDISTFLSVLKFVPPTQPVLVRGSHGIGKSAIIKQYADMLGYPLWDVRLGQKSEGDVLGLPKVKKDFTDFLPPEWRLQASKEPCVLFFDELDRAITQVGQSIFELTDSRKLYGVHLHPETRIIAAINGGGDRDHEYIVRQMDVAELDRWAVFDLNPSVDEWLDWGRDEKELTTAIITFLSSQPRHVEHVGAFEPSKVYPTRRSWHRLSKTGVVDAYMKNEVGGEVFLSLTISLVGTEAGNSFYQYLDSLRHGLTLDKVLEGDYIKELLDTSSILSVVDEFKAKKPYDKIDTKMLNNFGEFLSVIPPEICMSTYKAIDNQRFRQNLCDVRLDMERNGEKVETLLCLLAEYLHNNEASHDGESA